MSRRTSRPDRISRRNPARRLNLESLECRDLLTGFSVLTAADNGNNASPTPNSLRAAIIAANADPTVGGDTISFEIPGTGVQTIALESSLPAITRTVVIDGFTQTGASLAPGAIPTLTVELDGSGAGHGAYGLTFSAGTSSVVRGLSIVGFTDDLGQGGAGIYLEGSASGITVADNFLGVKPDGVTAEGNANGIVVASPNNTIGGTTSSSSAVSPANVISGNTNAGVLLVGSGATGNVVGTNTIGTNAAGTAALGDL
jgi:hypothetical protein